MFTTEKGPAEGYVAAETPIGIKASSMTLSVLTITLVAICLDRFTRSVQSWRELPLAQWTLFTFYCFSFIFSSVSAIIKDLEPNSSSRLCDASIFVCLFFYLGAKILQYHYLVERAHIVRADRRPRLQDKIYIFNCVFLILPYIALVIVNFYWRIGYINVDGMCINGLELQALVPLVAFEIFINVYMTLLFLFPFRKVLFKQQSLGPNSILQAMAYRTSIATCLMILATVGNLIGLMVLHGEPGWLCFMCCTGDVAFCVLMLHWVTKNDRERRGLMDSGAFPGELTQGLKLRPNGLDDCVIDAICRASRVRGGEEEADGHIRVTKALKIEVNGQTVHVSTRRDSEEDDDDCSTARDSYPMAVRRPRMSRHGSEDSIIEMEHGESMFRRRGSKDVSSSRVRAVEDSFGSSSDRGSSRRGDDSKV